MTNTPETWQERARKYVEGRNNPLSDMKSTSKLREGLEWVDTSGLSDEDRDLLNSVFAN